MKHARLPILTADGKLVDSRWVYHDDLEECKREDGLSFSPDCVRMARLDKLAAHPSVPSAILA